MKPATKEACSRCEYLDGANDREGVVISAMRQLDGPATATEIADACGDERGYSEVTVRDVLRSLLGVGRVSYASVDADAADGVQEYLFWLVSE